MRCIGIVTDREILGTAGLSKAKPRFTARAIIKNHLDEYAVLFAKDFGLYSLPGGGIDADENIEDALIREVYEETGVNIVNVEELGYVEENRAHCDYTQISYYFIVTTDSKYLCPHLTEEETKHGTTVDWYTFDEAYQLISSAEHTTVQRKFLQARDVLALCEYKEVMKKTGNGVV